MGHEYATMHKRGGILPNAAMRTRLKNSRTIEGQPSILRRAQLPFLINWQIDR